MKSELYIQKIIEETGLARKEIQDKVEEKNRELKGLISEEGALFIIAKELGVDLKEENKDLLKDIDINIVDINQNMKNITLIGRVKEIGNINSFKRKDGEIGRVGSFLLSDNTGDMRIVLWDDQVNLLKESDFKKNEMIKIINGNARVGRYGNLEIHVGRISKIILSPDDVDYKKYPKIKKKVISINMINLSTPTISIEGKILQKYPAKIFTRKDGNEGKVASIVLLDNTGTIRITFWNEDTEKINNIEISDSISIEGLSPRLSKLDSKTIDLFANNHTSIKKIKLEMDIEENLIKSISQIQEKVGLVSFKGIISSVDDLKKIQLKSGEDVSLFSFIVSDDTDGIRVTVWRELSEEYSRNFKSGMGLSLKNVMVKYNNFSNRKELSLIKESVLEIIDLKIKEIKSIKPNINQNRASFSGDYTKIDSINAIGIFEVKGFIAKEINKITLYEACPKCNKKKDNCRCDTEEKFENKMVVNLIIDDGTGTLRTTFFGNLAEKLFGEKTDNISKIKDTPDFEKFLEKKSSELLGKDLIIKGRSKFSDFTNSYELSAYDFQEINVNKELEKVMKEIET